MRNLKGKRFGRLLILRRLLINNKDKHIRWKCLCSCGNTSIISSSNLLRKITNTQSCGCLQKEIVKKSNTKHGMTNTKFYNIWQSMKERCDNLNHIYYNYYGGRGIIYNLKWKNFLGFKEDMYMKYLYVKKQLKIKDLSIERIDVNGNYCFENCTFINKPDQNKNTRRTKGLIL